jgi:hypothetical protein
MPDFSEMNRVLCGHHWENPSEWVRSVNELAGLSDDEIVEIERWAPPRNRTVE